MPYVRSGEIAEDAYRPIGDDQPVPNDGAVIVSGARFLADPQSFTQRLAAVGVTWPNDSSVAALTPYLERIAMVALAFPGFRDGRAYSQARILRERYGFRGELRATGQVLRDQLLFLLRAGFDSFEVLKESDAAAFADSTRRFGVFYQPTGDGRETANVRRLRLASQNAASQRWPTPCDTDGRTGS
jgi:uncharacterized protein (DUF934 family)